MLAFLVGDDLKEAVGQGLAPLLQLDVYVQALSEFDILDTVKLNPPVPC